MCSTQNKENLIFFPVSYTTIPRFFRVHIFRMHSNQSDIVCMWNIGTGKLII